MVAVLLQEDGPETRRELVLMSCEMQRDRLRIGIVFGGRSGEHEVSVASARSVYENLDREKYAVSLIGITKDGAWVLPADEHKSLTEGPTGAESFKAIVPVDHGALLAGPGSPGQPVDVVFPVLHGTYGEDGTVQGLLELSGIPYVGAGVLGSAVGMDKVVMKALFTSAGLPNAEFIHFKRHEWQAGNEAISRRVADEVGFPCFVKPANLGSSVGISKVKVPSELAAAIDLAAQYDLKVLVERSIEDAHEIECSVLGNDDPQTSVLGEILPSREFYSYEAKYVDDASGQIIPADLPRDVAERIRGMAVEAFRALDCAGLARVDFLVRRRTHQVYVSEINTLPGFTKISMYPKLWEASGLSYSDLLDRLIALALDRHAQRASLKTSYD